ncbi:MAG TPA: response regulator [Candidatus Dormibacteraeota bacterium]|jgi:signal transduction histidine kinase/DNA-binding response OmpR family regulator|nr:response regulator [Candidatus Dormibacteraeota bacterium]
MKDALPYIQDANAIAFLLLGVATAIGWAKRKDRSLGFLALAIILLSAVSLLGRIPAGYTPPFLPQLTLLAFVGSGYALLRFRGSLIPLPPRWHALAVIALGGGCVFFLVAQGLVGLHAVPIGVETAAGLVLIVAWVAAIVEPIVRFWLVARYLPAVQAWRLRSLSFGFGGLVVVLIFALGASAFGSNPAFQIVIQIAVLPIVPLLYVSFSPPSWLRRQWRSSEEEGLRAFMQDHLVGDDPVALADRALEWAMRLVGGAAAVAFDGQGATLASRGLTAGQVADLKQRLHELGEGVSRFSVAGVDRALFALPIGVSGSGGSLVVLAGPFTPRFGGDELSRVQQFMSAVAAAVDRARLFEKLKEANAALVDANHHKTVFLANMSHELRTPLNAILGFSELMIDAKPGQYPDPTKTRFLEQIHSSGKHLLGLINDILDLSKIEAGQMELRLKVVAVAEVVAQVASTVEPLAAQKQIHLAFSAPDAGQVLADEGKLKQMILNLVSNAIKFTPEGGTVTIAAARVADRLQIAVTDTGIGIAELDIPRLFKEFQQVDSSANRNQQGTGLGLALTRSLALLHGGDVWVESEVGKGSRFTIDLPLEARGLVRTSNGPHGREQAADTSRPLVIVVEDDPVAAELLTRQIEHAGFRTEVARTGAEALTLAKAQMPAAITLDILLPDMDGWEVMTRLKRDEATSHIPVVVVSVVDNPELGRALGALDYFVKPVVAKELVSRLRNFNFEHKTDGRQTTVLVVDDEEANRDWVKQVLEPAGFEVILASGGREAIELARSKKPDVVMLDLLMPEVNGFDVVQALAEHESTRSLPVMVLTAKHLTEADIDQLNGHVSTIIRRGSSGAVDLIGQLHVVLNKKVVEA